MDYVLSSKLRLASYSTGTIMTWVLLFALTLGSVLAYALTPLTNLAEHTQCSNTTMVFTTCSHGNATITR